MAHGASEPTRTPRTPGESPVGPVPDAVLEDLSEELLARGGRVWRSVTSDSMAPLLRAGDRILVEPCADRIRWGDVIVFRSPAGPTVHRVLGIRRDTVPPQIIEKGDANPFAGSIALTAVSGRVCRRDREGRSLDLNHGRGRVIQLILATLSLLALGGLLAGQAVRRLLHIERPTGIATRIAGLLRALSEGVARVLGTD